jgi:hypothetical protein
MRKGLGPRADEREGVMNRRSARCMDELVRVPNVIGTPAKCAPTLRIACLRSE